MDELKVPLIGDPDDGFLEVMARDSRARGVPPELAATKSALEAKLIEGAGRYSGIFLNPRLSEPHGVPLMRFIRARCPSTPIFYIVDGKASPLTEEERKLLTVRDTLRKPLTYGDLREVLAQAEGACGEPTLTVTRDDIEIVNMDFHGSDQEFVPVRVRDFVPGMQCYFDVYVRVSEEKYIKILRAGDAFSPERVGIYLSRNVQEFFIKKKVHEHYLHYCDELCASILGKKSLPVELKVVQVANLGEQTAKFLQMHGVSESAVTYARQFALKSHALTKEIGLENNEFIRRHLCSMADLDHSVSTAMVASLLAAPLSFDGERSAAVIGIAALLHDVGMQKMSEKIRRHDPSVLSQAELELYHVHPLVGEQIVRGVKGIDPVVAQAIAQHHERRTGDGFPARLGAGRINLVAEIIGVSEEFNEALALAIQDPDFDLQVEMEKRLGRFSSTVVSTFRVFFSGKF